MFPATPQRTAENLFVAPTPIIEILIVCVVLSGTPIDDASKMDIPAAVSAANPCTGSNLVILNPMVRMMRYPLVAVPIPITAPQSSIIHIGTVKVSAIPPSNNTSAKTPINFCPSLLP